MSKTVPHDSVQQHHSHRGLLTTRIRSARRAPVDAVIVPAARPADNLEHAVEVARALACPVIAICSRDTDPDHVVKLHGRSGTPVYAVDFASGSTMPALQTTEVRRHMAYQHEADTSVKRNLGLALAHTAGWQRILFLDDDIRDVDPVKAEEAAGVLGRFDVVGLRNTGFPDNSVVCHANRDSGGIQDTFIGGGAMLVGRSWMSSVFPDIYNEDWLFLLGEDGMARCARHGTFAQDDFYPYQTVARARHQEFGDCIAEGLFSLLDLRFPLYAADRTFWSEFLEFRDCFIKEILRRLCAERHAGIRPHIKVNLLAALHSLRSLDAAMCETFLAAWKHDRAMWQDFLSTLPSGLDVGPALDRLGVTFRSAPETDASRLIG